MRLLRVAVAPLTRVDVLGNPACAGLVVYCHVIAAAGAKRADGSPLFDYWVDVEGGTLAERPAVYSERAVAIRAAAAR